MSSQHNNPITNSIDFVSHGSKSTSIGNIEHQFNVTQTGSSSDPTNTALSSYSMQSDMLTSSYFNAEVGDLREMLGAYQIKLENNKHRAIFIGGMNNRDGNTSTSVDVNVGNYPIDIEETDTNTGKSWKTGEGIPNMKLKGNTFMSMMPIYPLTKQNPEINSSTITNTILNQFSYQSSFIDSIELLKNILGISTINYNLNNVKYINGLGNTITNGDFINPNASNTYTPVNKNTYISLTSAVTQWVKLAGLKVTINGISNNTFEGLLDNTGTPINIICVTDYSVKLIIDGFYCPRQMIGNGMSHQQLFIWLEDTPGDSSNSIIQTNSLLQFDLSNYLISNNLNSLYSHQITKLSNNTISLDVGSNPSPSVNNYITLTNKQNIEKNYKITQLSLSNTTTTLTLEEPIEASDTYQVRLLYSVTKAASNKISVNFGSNTVPTTNNYIYIKKYGGTRGYIYQVMAATTSNNITTLTVNYSVSNTGLYEIVVITDGLQLYSYYRFNIDEIRDRYCMLQLISHLDNLYNICNGLSLPLKLVEYISQVKTNTNISNLLYYISLYKLYNQGNTSTIDIGKKLAQIFHFIQNDNNYLTKHYGIYIKHWNDLTDSINSYNECHRFTCLNTNLNIILPSDWNTSTNKSPSGLIKSLNTLRMNKIKHVVITNLPGFDNGRYGTSMSSSNMIHGYFGSLSIDLSYSDTHTPVDVNGMTVHQWNYNNNTALNGNNNPSRWNVNADENYINLVTNANNNC